VIFGIMGWTMIDCEKGIIVDRLIILIKVQTRLGVDYFDRSVGFLAGYFS
jgi:hypothetical protein